MACANALLEKGERVLLIDAGFRLESEQQRLLDRIKEGSMDAVEQLKKGYLETPVSKKGVELKLAYGSDFAYRGAKEYLGFEGSQTGLLPSLAQGGLSNVWGAAMLPYIQKDMVSWPITQDQLAPHYEAALRMTGLAAEEDDLAELFPLYSAQLNPLHASVQAQSLLEGLDRMKSSLNRDGIIYGRARVAIGPNENQQQECLYCGKCLYGCPFGVIYNSAQDLHRLGSHSHDNFAYQSDIIVDKISGGNGSSIVSGLNRLSGSPFQVEAERVFLAGGVIPSSRIMLKSLEAYDHALTLKDSQYFVLPLLSSKGHGDTPREALYTLSQLFLEINDENISPFTIHLQLYTYNDLIPKVLRQKLWFVPGLREILVQPLQHRLLVIQGYLHSDHSGTIQLRLVRDPGTGKERLLVEGQPSTAARQVIEKISRKLSGHFGKLGLTPLLPAVDITPPGRGFHSGGSFPMSAHPSEFQSDIFGRVKGFPRVHLVDASVFPSIPATTITLTAMANAHRIASTWNQTA